MRDVQQGDEILQHPRGGITRQKRDVLLRKKSSGDITHTEEISQPPNVRMHYSGYYPYARTTARKYPRRVLKGLKFRGRVLDIMDGQDFGINYGSTLSQN